MWPAACGRCMSTVSPLSAVRASVSATTLHKRLVLSWPSLLFLFLLPVHPKVEQITAVFTAATRQKAWDHFSKAQRKNIDIWRKQCEVGIPLFVFFCFLLPPWLTAFFSAVIFESPGENWLIDTQSRRICCIQCLGCCFAGCFALTDRQTGRQQPLIARASLYPCSPNVKQRSDASSKVWDAAMATLLSRVKSQINYLSQVKSRKQVRRRECCTRKREDPFTRQHHRGFRRGAACWRTWRLWVCCSVGVRALNTQT